MNPSLLFQKQSLVLAGKITFRNDSHLIFNDRFHKLIILVPPKGPFVEGKQIKDGFTMVDVVAGRKTEIMCKATRANPAATLEWYKSKSQYFVYRRSVGVR